MKDNIRVAISWYKNDMLIQQHSTEIEARNDYFDYLNNDAHETNEITFQSVMEVDSNRIISFTTQAIISQQIIKEIE